MKVLLLSLIFGLGVAGSARAQTAPIAPKVAASSVATADTMLVEAACGQCRLGLQGKGCDLAVRFAGRAYFVTGTGIDSHGDAHARDGFCNAVRQAKVQGKVVNSEFNVSYFKLLPEASAAQKPKP